MFDAVAPGSDPVVRVSDRCDLQANGALALAKRLGRPPREIAEQVVAQDDLADVARLVEVAGAGFINVTLSEAYLARAVAERPPIRASTCRPRRLPGRAVVDYSAPNVAKEMHVGHLRRPSSATRSCGADPGHEVIRENHVGDWGTPFGMLIEHLVDIGGSGGRRPGAGDLTRSTGRPVRCSTPTPPSARAAGERVVLLQAGDPETLQLWQVLVDLSAREFQEVYDRLGVLLDAGDIVGESFYNPRLPASSPSWARRACWRSRTAPCVVFPPGFAGRDGEPMPLIVRKADGGYGYATTDLATSATASSGCTRRGWSTSSAHRRPSTSRWSFDGLRMAGWLAPPARCEHVPFGKCWARTRRCCAPASGETLSLADLLDEAVRRAQPSSTSAAASSSPGARRIARAIGIGAVKFADLSSDRVERLRVRLGPHALAGRLHGAVPAVRARPDPLDLPPRGRRGRRVQGRRTQGSTRRGSALALALLGFPVAIRESIERLAPHRLCNELFDLAQAFTAFYDACPVLRSDVPPELRASRLALCDVTARTLATGLDLLGIETPERM